MDIKRVDEGGQVMDAAINSDDLLPPVYIQASNMWVMALRMGCDIDWPACCGLAGCLEYEYGIGY